MYGMTSFRHDLGMILHWDHERYVYERRSVSALKVFNIAIPHVQAVVKILRLRRMRFFHRSPGTKPFF